MVKKSNDEIIAGAYIRNLTDIVASGDIGDEDVSFVFVNFSTLLGYYGTVMVVDDEYAGVLEGGVFSMKSVLKSPAGKLIEVIMNNNDFPNTMRYDLETTGISVEILVSPTDKFLQLLRLFIAPRFYVGGASLQEQDRILFYKLDIPTFFEDIVDIVEEEEEEYVRKKVNEEDMMFG